MSHMVDQAMKRPSDFTFLTAEEQWAIDKRLGLLDWSPTPEEVDEYKRRLGIPVRPSDTGLRSGSQRFEEPPVLAYEYAPPADPTGRDPK